jgi:predicted transcriptional regulator
MGFLSHREEGSENVPEESRKWNRRIRKIRPSDLWRLVILRGLGFSQKDIADKLGVKQEAISYQLKKLRTMLKDEGRSEYDVFIELVLESVEGTRYMSQGIHERLYESYEKKMFKSGR